MQFQEGIITPPYTTAVEIYTQQPPSNRSVGRTSFESRTFVQRTSGRAVQKQPYREDNKSTVYNFRRCSQEQSYAASASLGGNLRSGGYSSLQVWPSFT